jgi:hypothetical protein
MAPLTKLRPSPGVKLGIVILAALFMAHPSPRGLSQEPARRSVKDLKLKASPNGRYFVDQDGKPFFYLGDTAWLIFQRLDPKEVDEYLFYLYKEDDGPFPRDGFQPWRKAIAYEGSTQVGLMRRLFELRPWYRMASDQSVLATGEDDGSRRVLAARAEDGSFVIAYLPLGNPVSIHMEKVTGKTVKARWYDPRNGKWHEIGEYPNTGVRGFAPPSQGDRDDWVLVLDDAAKGYPTK